MAPRYYGRSWSYGPPRPPNDEIDDLLEKALGAQRSATPAA